MKIPERNEFKARSQAGDGAAFRKRGSKPKVKGQWCTLV